MKKIVVLMLALLVLVGCSSSDSDSSTVETDTPEVTETATPTAETEEKEKPTIKGSQAYDVVLSIEEAAGIEKPDTVEISDGFTWDATTTDYSYHINANEDHEISYAEFYVLAGDPSFLGFCGSMPYDEATQQEAMDWVNSNVGSEAETQFGDAIFILSNGETGPILTIKAVGYDDYLKDKMMNN